MKLEKLEGMTTLEMYLKDTATQERHNSIVEWGEGGLPWTTHLDAFVTFLSEYFGYDIYSEVAIRRSPMREKGTWKGQYFGVATDYEIAMQRALEDGDGPQLDLDFGDEQ